jgi:NAD(P)-dependent dehydrogenase (short-subunit alcohol dehydrogenase family)
MINFHRENSREVFFVGKDTIDVAKSRLAFSVLKDTFETNFFGLFSVTKIMLPLIRKSSSGRIVNSVR